MNYYVDTSALIKRYVNEVGSNWTRRLLARVGGNGVAVTEIASTEVFSTFARLRREGKLTAIRQARLENLLLLHLEFEYSVVPLDSVIFETSRTLVTRYPLRALAGSAPILTLH
ncbi:MAG: type II toxin-antitoxin system VapC family toxin [Chloroflexota bacterium]|nr:type II toxin-antitoxin system VapC family toxin [Chloroflexota bacterium]